MKAFVEQIEKDTALKAELEAMSKEYDGDRERVLDAKEEITRRTIAVAAKHGFTLTEEDFKRETQELTPNQLDAVTGGFFFCVAPGGGDSFNDESGYCACPLAGYGDSDDGYGGIDDGSNVGSPARQ